MHAFFKLDLSFRKSVREIRGIMLAFQPATRPPLTPTTKPPLTPTQVLTLKHGDGGQTSFVVWPRPESPDKKKAFAMKRARALASPHVPSAKGHIWPPGSRGALTAPEDGSQCVRSPPSPRTSRFSLSPNAPPPDLRRAHSDGPEPSPPVYDTGLLRSLSARAPRSSFDTITPNSSVPEPTRRALSTALSESARARQACDHAEEAAMATVRKIAWPTSETRQWAVAIIEQLASSASMLRVTCEAAEKAAVQAQNAQSKGVDDVLRMERWQRTIVGQERSASEQVWRRELASTELAHHQELQSMTASWRSEVEDLRATASLNAASHSARVADLEGRVASLQVQSYTRESNARVPPFAAVPA